MKTQRLTERQQEVLDFVRAFQSENGVPPSTREIQRQFRFASQTAVMGHLRALANKGMVEQLAGRSWGLKASEVQGHFELDVYGSIPAGLPAMQEQQPAERVRIDPAAFGLGTSAAGRLPERTQIWGLRVSGDSMVGAHILDGDLAVMVRREPRAGDVIAALVDETTTTLKRLVYVRGKPVLRAENPRYRDIVPERRLESQGVMIGLVRRLARG